MAALSALSLLFTGIFIAVTTAFVRLPNEENVEILLTMGCIAAATLYPPFYVCPAPRSLHQIPKETAFAHGNSSWFRRPYCRDDVPSPRLRPNKIYPPNLYYIFRGLVF
jgi:hypothetical protein